MNVMSSIKEFRGCFVSLFLLVNYVDHLSFEDLGGNLEDLYVLVDDIHLYEGD